MKIKNVTKAVLDYLDMWEYDSPTNPYVITSTNGPWFVMPPTPPRTGLLNDSDLIKLEGIITPFVESNVRTCEEDSRRLISYGLSSFGYDVRLSDADCKIFRRIPGLVTNPKQFDPGCLEYPTVYDDSYGRYFILPAHTYALGVSVEEFKMPDNVLGVCVGKSTYARCGIHVNCTPLEPGWQGYLTIEISNGSHADTRIYLNEGILQILFFAGGLPLTTYGDRSGKYQHQDARIVTARV